MMGLKHIGVCHNLHVSGSRGHWIRHL